MLIKLATPVMPVVVPITVIMPITVLVPII